MALAERRDCKDLLSVFECSSWQLVQHFPVATQDLAGLHWSPDGGLLAVWDCVLDYKVLLYSMDGHCLATYSAYEHALGVKTVAWAPSGQFLAIGSYDEKLRVLNHLTWRTVAEHSHPVSVDRAGAVVYQEVEDAALPLTHSQFPQQSHFETPVLPVTVPTSPPDPEKPNPHLGVGVATFSSDSRYLATRNDNMPGAVWVWTMVELGLAALLLLTSPVKDLSWDPTQPRLAIATGNSRLYLWSPAGCVSVCVPSDPSFSASRLIWHPSGSSLALLSSSHFCICYLSENS